MRASFDKTNVNIKRCSSIGRRSANCIVAGGDAF
jgi:hypothetical protein